MLKILLLQKIPPVSVISGYGEDLLAGLGMVLVNEMKAQKLRHQEHRMNAFLLQSHFSVLISSGNATWLTLLKTSRDFISLAAYHACYHVALNACLQLVMYTYGYYTVLPTSQFTFSCYKSWEVLKRSNITFNMSVKIRIARLTQWCTFRRNYF